MHACRCDRCVAEACLLMQKTRRFSGVFAVAFRRQRSRCCFPLRSREARQTGGSKKPNQAQKEKKKRGIEQRSQAKHEVVESNRHLDRSLKHVAAKAIDDAWVLKWNKHTQKRIVSDRIFLLFFLFLLTFCSSFCSQSATLAEANSFPYSDTICYPMCSSGKEVRRFCRSTTGVTFAKRPTDWVFVLAGKRAREKRKNN